jgi:hypothetical protein
MQSDKKCIYYWNSNNIGDLLNIYIGLKYNYPYFKPIGLTKNYNPIDNNNGIWLVGSVLKYIGTNNIILGVGFKNYTEINSFDEKYNELLYVRGNLSKLLLKRQDLKFFEPGLIINFFIDTNVIEKKEYLFIPHYNHMFHFSNINNKDFLFDVKFSIEDFSMITNYKDTEKIINLFNYKFDIINTSKLIISSSLHGIVFAIALDKPFIWFYTGFKDEPEFKFLDFFSFFNIKCKKMNINNLDINNINYELLKPYINYININNFKEDIYNFNNILKKYIG